MSILSFILLRPVVMITSSVIDSAYCEAPSRVFKSHNLFLQTREISKPQDAKDQNFRMLQHSVKTLIHNPPMIPYMGVTAASMTLYLSC